MKKMIFVYFKRKELRMKNIIVKDTIEARQPHYKKILTEFDGQQIQNNLVNFATCLQAWKKKEKKESA